MPCKLCHDGAVADNVESQADVFQNRFMPALNEHMDELSKVAFRLGLITNSAAPFNVIANVISVEVVNQFNAHFDNNHSPAEYHQSNSRCTP